MRIALVLALVLLSATFGELRAQSTATFHVFPQVADGFLSDGSAYYSTARLWNDGIIDPLDTRRVLGMGLSISANAPIPEPAFGVFRM